ncbi:MAG TPA: SRPBCC domain-containing protein [Candidatus Limnocylindrales bacterium]
MSTVITTPTDTQIVMTREFDAPRDLLFAALTRPELLKRWLGADGWELVECEIDLRVGGRWRFVSVGPDALRMGHGGTYTEIVPGSRLAYTETYDDQWFPGTALVEADLLGSTTLVTTLTLPSREVRDLVLASPMERGVNESHDRLTKLLGEINELDA